MFEHLDDPEPPALGAALRRGVRDRVRQRRTRRLAVGSALGATVLVLGAVALRIGSHLDRVERLDVAGLEPDAAGSGGATTILLVGTDAGGDRDPAGEAPGRGAADSMVLVRIDPSSASVRMLSIPRDLRVDDGAGAPTRLALLHGSDGAGPLVATIEAQLDVDIDHVAVVDLDGFRSVVETLGGVRARTPEPVRDLSSGLHIDDTGCTTLTGDQAVALVRARHLEVWRDGRWVTDPSGDVGRMRRQRAFVTTALQQVRRMVPNPFTLDRLAAVVTEHVAVDDGMDDATLLSLLRLLISLDDEHISSSTLPTQQQLEDGAVLLAPTADTAQAIAWLQGADGTPADPSTSVGPGPTSPSDAAGIGGVVSPCG